MFDRLSIALFASGKGSNFLSILNSIQTGFIPNTQIVLVISNNSDSGALGIAKKNNIPALHLSRTQFTSDETFNKTLLAALKKYAANFIVLAGYLKKIDSSILRCYRNKIVNIHPALLPAFGGKGMYGKHVHESVIASGVPVSGATVHIVDDQYDHGPIVLQKTVNILQDDTPDTLASRVQAIEHELYPFAIKLFAENRVRIKDRQVIIKN